MFRALLRDIRSLPPVYWTLWWGTLVNKAGGFVVPFLAFYVTAKGGSETEAGFMLALYGAGSLLSGFLGGVLTDRIGRRATMLLSLFGGAAALLGMGLTPSLEGLRVTTFIMGLTAELHRPAVSAAIADVVAPELRQRAYTHLYWVINVGWALAPALGGLAAKLDYFMLFAVDAGTLFVFGLIVLAKVPETRTASPSQVKAEADGSIAQVFADRTFMLFNLLVFGFAFVMWQNGTTTPLDMKRHGISELGFGLLMGLNGVMIVVLQPWLSVLLGRCRRTPVLAWGSLMFGVGFTLYGFVSSTAGYALAVAVWTLAEIATLPMLSTVVADLAPSHMRGRYQGVYATAWGLASFVGPIAGGAMLGGPGGRALWLGCGAIMVLVSLGYWLHGRQREARESKNMLEFSPQPALHDSR
jgi:MFS family permease